MGPIATLVSNYVEKKSARVKRQEGRYESERKVRMLPQSAPTSDPSDDDDTPSRENKKSRSAQGNERKKKPVSWTRSVGDEE